MVLARGPLLFQDLELAPSLDDDVYLAPAENANPSNEVTAQMGDTLGTKERLLNSNYQTHATSQGEHANTSNSSSESVSKYAQTPSNSQSLSQTSSEEEVRCAQTPPDMQDWDDEENLRGKPEGVLEQQEPSNRTCFLQTPMAGRVDADGGKECSFSPSSCKRQRSTPPPSEPAQTASPGPSCPAAAPVIGGENESKGKEEIIEDAARPVKPQPGIGDLMAAGLLNPGEVIECQNCKGDICLNSADTVSKPIQPQI